MARTCTLKGNPLNLEGPELKVGDAAPNATVKKSLVDTISIADTNGKARIFSVVPSLDTPVCAEQTKKFNEAAAKMANVDFYTVSADLPTAQARFCGAEGIDTERVKTLSDHMGLPFGKAFGTAIPDLGINSRAVFVLDGSGTIKHVEYVGEVADHPNYDAVLKCAGEIAG